MGISFALDVCNMMRFRNVGIRCHTYLKGTIDILSSMTQIEIVYLDIELQEIGNNNNINVTEHRLNLMVLRPDIPCS